MPLLEHSGLGHALQFFSYLVFRDIGKFRYIRYIGISVDREDLPVLPVMLSDLFALLSVIGHHGEHSCHRQKKHRRNDSACYVSAAGKDIRHCRRDHHGTDYCVESRSENAEYERDPASKSTACFFKERRLARQGVLLRLSELDRLSVSRLTAPL